MLSFLRSRFFISAQYLRYWLEAVDHYSLQTPFVYKFYNKVIADQKAFYAFEDIERLRAQLLKDLRSVYIKDLGAGSTVNPKSQRKVASIAKHSLSNPKFCRFIFRTILFCRPENMLELGTSLGINSLYMSLAIPNISLITLEGCPETARIAEKNFSLFKAQNIEVIQGNIDFTLPNVLNDLEFIDFVYFDANHTKEATLRYFELCLKKARNKSIFIFDDIHLSKDMTDAWKTICQNPAVTLSIDVFDAGVVFFEKGLTKSHYVLEF